MTRGQILFAFLPLLLLVTSATIGCQPEDEVQATPSPDRSTEIPTTTARTLFLDGIRHHLAQAHERAGDIDASVRLYDDVARYNFNSVEFALVRDEASRKLQSCGRAVQRSGNTRRPAPGRHPGRAV